MIETLSQPWPWWVAGPLIGLIVPLLLLAGSKQFGLSTSFRQICAATAPGGIEYFRYDWKRGMWRLMLVLGIIGGAAIAATLLANPDPVVGISAATHADL
ncbi:MAG: YeeE/YedE family protein, partial [Gemmatimonadetes bacterium]|nr:YeeE/YedE family protein [Gemmatimonadota bacterium]